MSFKYKAIYYYTKFMFKVDKDKGMVPKCDEYPVETFFISWAIWFIGYPVLWGLLQFSFNHSLYSWSILFAILSSMIFGVIYPLFRATLMTTFLLLTKEEKRSLEKRLIKDELERQKKCEEKKLEEKSWRAGQWKTY